MTARRTTRALVLGAALLVGCVAAPLGDDWEALSPEARDARALDALRDLFAARVDGAGQPLDDREVLRVDLEGIDYATERGTSRLRWADVQSIEQDDHPELPARPVDLRLYLRPGSPSEGEVTDLVEPTLVATGLFRRHVLLRMRPLGARARLVQALDHVRARTAPDLAAITTASTATVTTTTPATTTPAATTASPASEAEVERKLRLLRAWRDEGLISEEDYEVRRRALLDRL